MCVCVCVCVRACVGACVCACVCVCVCVRHEIRIKKCSDTCQCKIKFILTIIKTDLTLVEIYAVAIDFG